MIDSIFQCHGITKTGARCTNEGTLQRGPANFETPADDGRVPYCRTHSPKLNEIRARERATAAEARAATPPAALGGDPLPASIRGSRGITAWLVATAPDGSGLYFHELTKGSARRGARRGRHPAAFRATAKHYYRVDAQGRRQTWTRTVYSGARQTGHLKPQPPTEGGRWAWLPKCERVA